MIKLFELGFVLKAVDAMSGVLKAVETRIEGLNEAVAGTARWRQAGTSMALMGAGIAAAGAAVALPLKAAVDAAAAVDEAMQHLRTNLDAGAAGTREYAQAQQFAEAMSVRFNYAQTDIIDNLYRAKSFLGDWNTALAVTQASLAVAKGNMGDAATVGQQLATVFNDFGDKTRAAGPQISHFADLMAYISRNGAFHDVDELNEALGMSIGAAKAAGMSLEDTLATLNAFKAVGMSNPGEALEESLAAFGRGKLQKDLGVALATTASGGLDVIQTFVNLRKEMGAGTISVQQFEAASKALGIRGERALTIPIDQLLAAQKALDNPAVVNGAALQGANTMLQSFNEQMGILQKKWEIFKEAGGQQLLAPLETVGHMIGMVLDKLAGFAKAHPMITKFVVIFAAIGAAIAIVVGGLIAMAGGLMAAGSFIGIGGGVIAAIVGIGLAIAATVAAIATWWRSIEGFFTGLPKWIESIDWKSVGIGILKLIGEGFIAGLEYLTGPLGTVAKLILDHFKGHSPPPLGPLRDLDRVNLVGTIADTMKPGPIIAAVRRVALVTAIAAPMLAGVPAMAAGTAARGSGAGLTVVVNVTLNGGAGGWADEARKHGRIVADVVARELAKRSRTEFE